MHCPRCGQQQISEKTRFCSRCGLPLDLVAEVVANNGTLPRLADLPGQGGWFTRRNGLKLAALWFAVFSFLLTPLAGVTDAPEEVIAGLAIIGFFGTVFLSLISFMFLPKAAKAEAVEVGFAQDQGRYVGGERGPAALPGAHSIPANAYTAPAPGNWRDTNDLQPTSVTEGTTRIFKEQG
jgi:hypothetical protein